MHVGIQDTLTNSVVVSAELTNSAPLSDTSAVSLTVPGIVLQKSIYAIDGNLLYGLPEVQPGQTITFRLQADLLTGNASNLVLSDYLSLPLFNGAELATLSLAPSVTAPLAGVLSYGPTHTLHLLAPGATPSIAVDAQTNLLSIDFGTFDSVSLGLAKIDLLFTLTLQDEPYAGELALANEALASYDNTFGEAFLTFAFANFELELPRLSLSKGVVSTDADDASFTLSEVGQVAFLEAGLDLLGGAGFLGTFTSLDLSLNPIDSDIFGIDGGTW